MELSLCILGSVNAGRFGIQLDKKGMLLSSRNNSVVHSKLFRIRVTLYLFVLYFPFFHSIREIFLVFQGVFQEKWV